jgi:hypothetical protein
MFKTMILMTTAAVISIGTAASAFACENFIGTATNGGHNRATLETWGDQYLSVDQDGYYNAVRGRIQGRCNGVVIGQYGDGNRAKTNVAGRRNAVGMLQYADDVSARTNVVGAHNGVAVYQSRSGSRASTDVAGRGNQVVIRQH